MGPGVKDSNKPFFLEKLITYCIILCINSLDLVSFRL